MAFRSTAPRSVLIAGCLVGAQGLAGVAFAIAVLVHAMTAAGKLAGMEYGETGYYAVLSLGVLAVAYGLLRGHRWSRTPAALLQILLLAVCWFALSSSGQGLITGLGTVLCVGILVLLFTRDARVWAARQYT